MIDFERFDAAFKDRDPADFADVHPYLDDGGAANALHGLGGDLVPTPTWPERGADYPRYSFNVPFGVLQAEGNLPITMPRPIVTPLPTTPSRRRRWLADASDIIELQSVVALLLLAAMWVGVLLAVAWEYVADGARRFIAACRRPRKPDMEKEVLTLLRGRVSRRPRGMR